MQIHRRVFLYHGLLTGGALALHGLLRYGEKVAAADYRNLIAVNGKGAYGPLKPAKALNTGEALLALPEGFQYTVFGKAGTPMSDKTPTPARHDGMAAFEKNGRVYLVRNHEINNRVGREGAAFGALSYDALAGGGTTTLIVDRKSRQLLKDYVSLSGTLQNCAGGPTPWGSWISCEETILGTAAGKDREGRPYGGFAQNHGYCFEVPAFADRPAAPMPLKAMGRFVHEAIAVDPKTGIVYETEDNNPAGLYRFIPKRKKVLAEGGRLQMLAIKDRPNYDTRTGQKAGTTLPAAWVDIADPDPAAANSDSLAVYKQGKEKGGATFARLEGAWYGDGRVFVTATSGGDRRLGQVWEYAPNRDGDGTLTLLFESPSVELLDMPDNLTVSPRGGLLLCEDGSGEQYLRGLTRQGQVFDFAKNIVPGFERGEMAGATFSPDGQTLFVNIQAPGLTFAIWGPWKNGAL